MNETAHGVGKKVGLVHGFADRSTVWHKLITLMPDEYQSIAPEFPWGQPGGAAPSDSAVSLSHVFGTRWPDVVVAHSRGAYEVVRELIAGEHSSVTALVLIGWANPTPEGVLRVIPPSGPELLDMCRLFVGERLRLQDTEMTAAGKEKLAGYLMRRLEGWNREVAVEPSELVGVTCRTLVLVGEADWTSSTEDAAALVRVLPDAELNVMEGCGHWPMLERPERVMESILTFADQGTRRLDEH